MTRKTDKQLGMLKPIRRRDFVQGALVTAGTALTAHQLAAADALSPPPAAEHCYQRRISAHPYRYEGLPPRRIRDCPCARA